MTISGEYNSKYQIFHISRKDTVVKSLAIVEPERTFFQTRFQKKGYDVKVKEITSIYDNRYLFEIISDYEKEGWFLKSHGFGIGLADETSTITACQYLMTRVKK